MNYFRWLVSFVLFFYGVSAFAQTAQRDSSETLPCDAHIEFVINSKSGTWRFQAMHINQLAYIKLKDTCENIDAPAPGYDPLHSQAQVVQAQYLDSKTPLTVEHVLADNNTYYMAMVFTVVQVNLQDQAAEDSKNTPEDDPNIVRPGKACVFYIAANGFPRTHFDSNNLGYPINESLALEGAKCSLDHVENSTLYTFTVE